MRPSREVVWYDGLLRSRIGTVKTNRWLDLEPNQEYYFLANVVVQGGNIRIILNRNAKEVVLHEMSGALYSNWNLEK